MRNFKITLLVLVAFALIVVAVALGVRLAASDVARVVTTLSAVTGTAILNSMCIEAWPLIQENGQFAGKSRDEYLAHCSTIEALPEDVRATRVCATSVAMGIVLSDGFCGTPTR